MRVGSLISLSEDFLPICWPEVVGVGGYFSDSLQAGGF